MSDDVETQPWYPDTGPFAVLSRLAVLGSIVAVVVAVFLPPHLVPKFAHSLYLEHFAAYYVIAVACLAAMPRTQLRRIASGVILFALLLESTHLLNGAPFMPLMENWVADVGGAFAGVVPVAIDRFRRRFRPKIKPDKIP